MRGLFVCTLLARLEEASPGFLNRTDLFAGTSTGGILALGFANGSPPDELARLYRQHGAAIFDDSLWDDVVDIGKAIGADYTLDGLRLALRSHFAPALRLRDLPKRVLVPTFDLDAPANADHPRVWKPKFFHNYPGQDSDGEELVRDVALRTSAAPTYFPSYQGYIDGGVVANNPSMAALAQALALSGAGRRLDDVTLLSVGTGIEPKYIQGDTLNWGWTQWASPIVSLITNGLIGVADYQCRQLLGARYLRLNTFLDRAVPMDDPRPETLEWIEGEARRFELGPAVRWLARVGW